MYFGLRFSSPMLASKEKKTEWTISFHLRFPLRGPWWGLSNNFKRKNNQRTHLISQLFSGRRAEESADRGLVLIRQEATVLDALHHSIYIILSFSVVRGTNCPSKMSFFFVKGPNIMKLKIYCVCFSILKRLFRYMYFSESTISYNPSTANIRLSCNQKALWIYIFFINVKHLNPSMTRNILP